VRTQFPTDRNPLSGRLLAAPFLAAACCGGAPCAARPAAPASGPLVLCTRPGDCTMVAWRGRQGRLLLHNARRSCVRCRRCSDLLLWYP